MKVRIEENPATVALMAQQQLAALHEAVNDLRQFQVTMTTITDRLQQLETHAAEQDAQTADMALALKAIDENIRALAETLGGLQRELTPSTGLGRLLRRMMKGADEHAGNGSE